MFSPGTATGTSRRAIPVGGSGISLYYSVAHLYDICTACPTTEIYSIHSTVLRRHITKALAFSTHVETIPVMKYFQKFVVHFSGGNAWGRMRNCFVGGGLGGVWGGCYFKSEWMMTGWIALSRVMCHSLLQMGRVIGCSMLSSAFLSRGCWRRCCSPPYPPSPATRPAFLSYYQSSKLWWNSAYDTSRTCIHACGSPVSRTYT